MKIRFVYVLVLLLCFPFYQGCRSTPKPLYPDDVPVKIKLKKNYVSTIGTYTNPEKGLYFEGSGEKGHPQTVGEAIILGMFNVMIDGLQIALSGGTDVSVHPMGYPQYMYKLYWGSNKIYIPIELKDTGWLMQILVDGNYVGEESISMSPGQKKIKLTGKRRYLTRSNADNRELTPAILKTEKETIPQTAEGSFLKKGEDILFKTESEKKDTVSIALPLKVKFTDENGMLSLYAVETEEISIKGNKSYTYSCKKEVIFERGIKKVSSGLEYVTGFDTENPLYSSIFPQPGCIVHLVFSIIEVKELHSEEFSKTILSREFSFTTE